MTIEGRAEALFAYVGGLTDLAMETAHSAKAVTDAMNHDQSARVHSARPRLRCGIPSPYSRAHG